MTEEKEFRKNFKKTIWGYATIYAKDLEEAKEKFDEGEIDDEFDNKSDYEWDDKFEEKK
jgi:hypothetical protein